jgi:hypothetical protein
VSDLRYTLVSDGSSDQILKHPINWLLQQLTDRIPIARWADPTISNCGSFILRERIINAIECYPCELLFIHRDAEKQPREKRISEIQKAMKDLPAPPQVCIIPVRMTEAWFLINGSLLQRAANNPAGTTAINLPALNRVDVAPRSLSRQLQRTGWQSLSKIIRRYGNSRLSGRLKGIFVRFLAEFIHFDNVYIYCWL